MKKKVLAMMLGAMMCFSMVGCGSDDATTTTNEAASVETGVADESTTTDIDSGDVDAKGQESDTVETADSGDKLDTLKFSADSSGETHGDDYLGRLEGDIELEIQGVKFKIGDKTSDVLPKMEAEGLLTGIRPDTSDYQAIYYYLNDKDFAHVTYWTETNEQGEEVISKITHYVPIEAYRSGQTYDYLKINGYAMNELVELLENAGVECKENNEGYKELCGSFSWNDDGHISIKASEDPSVEVNITISQ